MPKSPSICIYMHRRIALKEAEVGVKCREQLISVSLYADDAVILAENEKLLKRGLEVLMEWCKEWMVEVNVEKSGVMHIMRRKGVKRTVERFYVGGKEIGVVEEYKYLGSVVNEYLTNVRMVEERRRKCGRKGFCHLFPPPTGLDLCWP